VAQLTTYFQEEIAVGTIKTWGSCFTSLIIVFQRIVFLLKANLVLLTQVNTFMVISSFYISSLPFPEKNTFEGLLIVWLLLREEDPPLW
jgi:hypothetical protein